MDPFVDVEASKYTLVFDIFSLTELLNYNSRPGDISEKYLKTLINKNILTPYTEFSQSSWITDIWKNRDIFTKKQQSLGDHRLSLNRWLYKIQLLQKFRHTQLRQSIDYRFSAIEITLINIGSDTMSFSHNIIGRTSTAPVNDKLRAELLGVGVIRLFKDSENHINVSKIETDSHKHVPGDNTTVAILSVPFYFSASDLLLGFFDEEDIQKLSHIRLIKSSAPNRFIILLKFREKRYVKPFLRKYQGRKFNSFEPETCSVVEIKEIIFRPKSKHEVDNLKNALPYLLEDPFTNESGKDNLKEDKLLPKKYTELATCPVCLDRLDSNVTGLFTIPCQHTFHSTCLSKWKDDTCPVCRYTSKPVSRRTNDASGLSLLNSSELDNTEMCSICGLDKNLWICLICGSIGCGRYDNQHAIHHWEQTGHCFAMETDTQRVWDYAEDGYVHRLVQNEADGKIVELPLHDGSKKTTDEKVDKIGFEYSKILISQMESQREYYEKIIADLNNSLNFFKDTAQQTQETVNSVKKEMDIISIQLDKRKKEGDEVRANITRVTNLNTGLIQKLKSTMNENEELKEKNIDLNEQVTDMMFYLESQEKFKDASDDVKEGKVVIVSSSSSNK